MLIVDSAIFGCQLMLLSERNLTWSIINANHENCLVDESDGVTHASLLHTLVLPPLFFSTYLLTSCLCPRQNSDVHQFHWLRHQRHS